MKNSSFIQVMLRRMLLQLGLLLLILAAVLGTSYGMMRDEMHGALRSMVDIYGNNLTYQINKMDNLILNLVYKNDTLSLLESDDESVRYHASMELRTELDNLLMEDAGADMLVIAGKEHGITLDVPRSGMTFPEKEALRSYTGKLLEQDYGNNWAFVSLSGKTYLYRDIRSEDWVVAVYLSTENWMSAVTQEVAGMTFVAADWEERIWAVQGKEFFSWTAGSPLSGISEKGRFRESCAMGDGRITLYAYQDLSNIWGQVRLGMVLVVGVILTMVLFMAWSVITFRREVLAPVHDMVRSMEQIKQGDYDARLERSYRYMEFNLFRDTFNRLMNEILGLKIASYEKQIALSETELRCIRLQIRPHFFLNAMTTISSLSMQGKNTEIQQYIDALSKNIRYLFRAGLHTVPLREEIQHVENYFEMQDLKYPGSVFYFIDMPEELGGWQIPQMLIHTIIENEYKYAVAIGSMLTILIRIGVQEKDGEKLLVIEIEDDGKGYPQEVLDYMRREELPASGTGERVGLRSIRQMLEIMYDRKDLFTISNVSPHGCFNHMIIPEKPLHVVDEGVPNQNPCG